METLSGKSRLFVMIIMLAALSNLFAGTLTPPSGPVRATMKALDEIDSSKPIKELPFVISSSGNYKVVGNLSSTGEGIVVNASNVTIDLDGYTLQGAPGVNTNGIFINATSQNVKVKNGRLSGWGGNGLRCNAPNDNDCDDITAINCAQNGLMVRGSNLTGCVAINNGQAGIFAAPSPGNPLRFESGVCRNNGGDGMKIVVSEAGATIIEVNNSTFDSNGINGDGSGVALDVNHFQAKVIWSPRSNIFCNNNSNGVSVNLNEVSVFGFQPAQCLACSNAKSGIAILDNGGGAGIVGSSVAVNISDTQCSRNGESGISFTNASPLTRTQDFRATGVLCDGNGDMGILLYLPSAGDGKSSATITDSQTNNNRLGGGKVSIKDFTICKRYTSIGNGTGDFIAHGVDDDCDGDTIIEDCVFNGNTGCGAVIQASSFVKRGYDLKKAVKCKNTQLSSNGADGLRMESFPSIVEFSDVTASNNARGGIRHKGWDGTIKGRIDMENSRLIGNGEDGVLIEPFYGDIELKNVSANNNSGCGFRHKGWDGTVKGVKNNITVEESRFHSNGADGLQIEGGDVSLASVGTSAQGNTGTGINLGAKKEFKGHVTLLKFDGSENEAGGASIRSSGGGVIKDCVTDNNTSDGLALKGSYFSVSDNRASGNSINGINIFEGSGNQVARNFTSANQYGISIGADGNSVSENSGSGNTTGVFINANPSTNDLAPASSASGAVSPVGNIEY